MRNRFIILVCSCLILTFLVGCEKYLEGKPEGELLDETIFSNYPGYQAFLNGCYNYLVDWNKSSFTCSQNLGGETIAIQGWFPSRAAMDGNYLGLLNGRSNYKNFSEDGPGWWSTGWAAIRVANQAISRIDMMKDGTEEERNFILGQSYFFRALFHMEIWRAFGAIPYIEEVLNDQYDQPRFFEYKGKSKCQAVAEKMVEDLDRAIKLLPEKWPDKYSFLGKVTKGTALAYKARVLLTAGSPLFNEFSDKGPVADPEYMIRAAEAAGEVLQLVNQGVYGLTPFSAYKSMFAVTDESYAYNEEIIFSKPTNLYGISAFNMMGRLYVTDGALFGVSGGEYVTQNYVDRYEMADGTKYKETYDEDNNKRWDNRDPRFRATIYVDGDTAGISDKTILELYNGGRTRANGNTLTPYIVHKYWPKGVNKEDGKWDDYYYHTPLMRLADVYLMYAEACYLIIGDPYASSSNHTMTAIEAVNKVRNRAGMPDVDVSLAAYDGSFLDLVLNERAVELAFEGHYWFDQRRWKRKPAEVLYDLQFDKDYTNFQRRQLLRPIFDSRHWWMPFPDALVRGLSEFPQNPGW